MAQPTPYDRQFSFQDFQAQEPTTPLPGDEVDGELNAVKLTIDQTLVNLAKIQRDDGALKNGIVTQETLSPSLSIGFTLRGTWAAGINYVLGDGVTVENKFYRATASALSTAENAPEEPGAPWEKVADFGDAEADTIRATHFPPANDTVNLPAIRRRLRNIPDLAEYGILSSGSTEYGQTDFDALVAGLIADGRRQCLVPAGNYRLGEQVTFARGVIFEGESKSSSVFKFYHANTGMVFTGAQENGGALKRLSVVNDSGAQAVAYVQAIASVDGTSPDFLVIEDCNFTGFSGATVQYGIILNGSARDGSAPNLLKGIRNCKISSTSVFNCDVLSTDLRQARDVELRGLKHFQADGAVAKLSIGGASGFPSATVQLSACVPVDVAVGWADRVIGLDNYINDATVSADANNCAIGIASGAVTNNSTSSFVLGS